MYLMYNAILLTLGTPLNRLFLIYVAALALAVTCSIAVAVTARPDGLARHCSPTLPVRGLAIYIWIVVG